MIPRIVAANNTQNAILAWDRRSNDPVQIRLGQQFAAKGFKYVHRRDNTKLKPRWDVHLSGDVDQLGCAGESLSSVLGECPGSVV